MAELNCIKAVLAEKGIMSKWLAKKQYTSCTDLWYIAFIGHKAFVLLQIFHSRLAITNSFHVTSSWCDMEA